MEEELAVLGIFFAPALVIITLLVVQLKSRKLANETLRHMVDAGQSPDPELMTALMRNASDAVQDRRRAILLLMFALAIAGFALSVGKTDFIGIAIFPLTIGIGYLLTAKFAARALPPS
ncbi:MAG: DUF6249 domain-containing protein [Pseudomonadota bacterium]